MPFQVYADDSGCKGQVSDIVIGGLIGRAEEWVVFSDRWSECLNEPPRVPYFKLYHAEHQSGPFSGLSDAQCRAKTEKLVRVLNHPDFHFDALHITVNVAAYKRAAGDLKGKASNPYFYAFHMYIRAAAMDLVIRGEKEQCEMFFDEHPSLGDKSREWYPFVRTLATPAERAVLPVDPYFKSDQVFLPLQPSDLIAGMQMQTMRDGPGAFDWLAPAFTNLGLSPCCIYLDQAQFEKMAKASLENPVEATLERVEELRKLMEKRNRAE